MTPNILEIYSYLRRPHTSKYWVGVVMGKAKQCLNYARHIDSVNRRWSILENFGMVRIDIMPDYNNTYEDLAGDTYDVDVVGNSISGGKRTVLAQKKKFDERCQLGVVGIVGKKRCPCCNGWVEVDSIWGIMSDEWAESEHLIDIKSSVLNSLIKEKDILKGIQYERK